MAVIFEHDFKITNNTMFGSQEDILFNTEEKIPVGGTIIGTIDINREFIPGDYKLYLVQYENDIIVMLSKENIDPIKIHNYLMEASIGKDFMSNYINRYDWCHSIWWGKNHTNYKEICHKSLWIVNEKLNIEDMNLIEVTEIHKYVNKLTLKGKIVGFTVQFMEFKQGDWLFGMILIDKEKHKGFSLICESFYTYVEKHGEKELEKKINMNEFIRDYSE